MSSDTLLVVNPLVQGFDAVSAENRESNTPCVCGVFRTLLPYHPRTPLTTFFTHVTHFRSFLMHYTRTGNDVAIFLTLMPIVRTAIVTITDTLTG